MTDLEILELAAKAAGIDYDPQITDKQYRKWGLWLRHDPTDGEPKNWNPLNDDGDALRLAINLGISLETDAPICIAFDELGGEYKTGVDAWRVFPDATTISASEIYESDQYAAARRAIVRVAAEMGRNIS